MNDHHDISWGLIIILLICFWPVGLYLLVKKLKSDRKATINNRKTLKVLGIILVIIGIITLSNSNTIYGMNFGTFILSIFMFSGGLALLIYSFRIDKRAKRYRNYINMLVNEGQVSLDTISANIHLDYQTVCKDLTKMINDGYFDAYINHAKREIILKKAVPTPVYNAQNNIERVYICKSCGAKNVAKGNVVAKCEYCDSPLHD